MRKVLSMIALTIALSACLPEDLGGSIVIVNQTDKTLFFATADIPVDGRYTYDIDGCVRPGLELRDDAGAVVVHVDEKVCAGQRLTVRGLDDYTLESSR